METQLTATTFVALARGAGFWTQVIGPFATQADAHAWVSARRESDKAWSDYFRDVVVEPLFSPEALQ